MSVEATSPGRSGPAVLWDVIVAPTVAFAELRERTHWGWAYLAVCVLGLIGGFLLIPASEHAVAATLAQQAQHDPNMAALSPERRLALTQQTVAVAHYSWFAYPIVAIIAILVAALVCLVANAIARGSGTFARLFGLAANVAVINFGIAYLLTGVLAAARDPASFASQRDVLTLVPSLAWLAPGGSAKLVTFLAAFNPFQIWSFLLLGTGLQTVARIRRVPAFVAAALVSFGGVLFALPFAK